MSRLILSIVALGCALHAVGPAVVLAAEPAPPQALGETTVLKWKDGKQAAFYLAFDDACPTHLKTVIPELVKRKMVGTFYVIAGSGNFKDKPQWKEFAKSPYVVLANHTFTHKGAATLEQFEKDVVDANAVLAGYIPNYQAGQLVSFGTPGGVKWGINAEQRKEVLARNNLVLRADFWGAVIHVKTVDDMKKYVDAAVKKGEMSHLDFHGVGGDWLPTPTDWFLAMLDKLEAEQDKLWIADHLTIHKYATERKTAKVQTLAADEKQVRLKLTSDADPKLYDARLTLETRVPAGWTACEVKDGGRTVTATVTNGVVRYDATPGGGEITLSRGERDAGRG